LRVFYASWQLQCCGDTFRVGDTVTWTAIPADADIEESLGTQEGSRIDWLEEHHPGPDESLDSIEGVIMSIRAIRQRFIPTGPRGNILAAAPGETVGTDLDAADGWESEPADPDFPDHRFTGYVVTLS
jgi:hypothetical protein